jgi:hypothetical protein
MLRTSFEKLYIQFTKELGPMQRKSHLENYKKSLYMSGLWFNVGPCLLFNCFIYLQTEFRTPFSNRPADLYLLVKYFATGSRDKAVVMWGPGPTWEVAGSPLLLPESVTAVAMPQVSPVGIY